MKKQLILGLMLLFTAGAFAQTEMPTAESVLKKAYAQASKEKKKVMVIFHASWCGWCKKMDASMAEPALSKFFTDNYVIAHLDVLEQPEKKNLENPGAADVMKQYQGDKAGLPFWFVADTKGKKLGDSQIRPEGAALDTYGTNVGCPADDNEVAHFIKVLKGTSKLNDSELAQITERFAKNKPAPRPAAAKPAATGSR
ncbi:thioredoxin family protein [Mucilaginibacter myungsuensis]|uniref:Thioredoxin family protein n=1 Tax=Mucilaginibacter myungsuensis TaxID=649104 RepID=A0A929PUA2_9SPHI|nr:thioredoxin family protein [Mucilaginibacter myungsuensis]MBE9660528.1 thioredoxin family protein [Mucilaginibacter myungsuensis]MDN3600573.1 thioredoxin family protein [Mucilaginibacter myungsuensis]